MKKRTPVEAYRLLSSPSNKPIVFLSSRGTPCSLKLFMIRIISVCCDKVSIGKGKDKTFHNTTAGKYFIQSQTPYRRNYLFNYSGKG